MTILLRHLRTNLVAYLALVVAMGGTSYAAVQLPKDSVKAKQIAKNAVRSSEVKNGSLRANDFKTGQLPRGPRGAAGASAFDTALPAVRVLLSTGQAIPDNSTQPSLLFDVEDYDQGGMHSSANPDRLVAPRAGIYRVDATVNWNTDADGSRFVALLKNGQVNQTVGAVLFEADDANVTVQTVSGEVALNANEYVTVSVANLGAGNPLNVRGNPTPITFASMSFVSPRA